MSLIVDLGESRMWLSPAKRLPEWLSARWLADNNAQLLCRLSEPDHLTTLRALVPCVERLVAIPALTSLSAQFDASAMNKLTQSLMQRLGAEKYLTVTHDAVESPAPANYINLTAARRSVPALPKPALALVSPMPPAASGIANYCAEIMPALAKFYSITLVVEDPTNLAVDSSLYSAVVSHAAFVKGEAQVDRIMYHMGNSHFHYDYLSMIKARPGVVVLHDIYLGDCIFSNFREFGQTQLLQAIYASHGWSAMQDCCSSVKTAIALYPACGELFQNSYGVIVHNRFALENLGLFFSDRAVNRTCSIPLARQVRVLPDSLAARDQIGIADNTMVFSTFGQINHNKCIDELIDAWQASGLAADPGVRLMLVGNCSEPALKERLLGRIAQLPRPANIIYTGFIDNAAYDEYLSATDIALQLRRNSRGESSAALLDCMAAALPTIINQHGSMAEVPAEAVLGISDDFRLEDLSEVLLKAKRLLETGTNIGTLAQRYVQKSHSPGAVAQAYRQQLEAVYASSSQFAVDQTYLELLSAHIGSLSSKELWACTNEFNDFMACAAADNASPQGPQLLVDVSSVVQHGLNNDIQHVVRNILQQLLKERYIGYRVEAIYYDFAVECFRYARNFSNHILELPALHLNDDPVETRRDDIYLGLDLVYSIAGRPQSRRSLQYWRGRGVQIYHVIYDLVPLTLPDCFPPDQLTPYYQWLQSITDISDGIVCISRAVAKDYHAWQASGENTSANKPSVGFFYPGAELEADTAETIMTAEEQKTLRGLTAKPYLLMVGAVEPIRGHGQVLDAFEGLWADGVAMNLIIVGSTGGGDEQLVDRLNQLNDESEKLHWLNASSASLLHGLYQNAEGTLVASKGEGFEPALIEAAYYGSALLARDLPAFQEVCGDSAWYFNAETGRELTQQIKAWLSLKEGGAEPRAEHMSWIDWQESTNNLLQNILAQRWYIPAPQQ